MSKKILVAEDETFAQKAIRQLLENHGYSVATASDGSTAVNYAVLQTADLIILDLSLLPAYFPSPAAYSDRTRTRLPSCSRLCSLEIANRK